MKTMTVIEAARHFSDLISRVHYRGESTLLLKGGKPMARVLPARKPSTGRDLAALWGGLPHLSAKEAATFGQDLEGARRNLPPLVAKWD